MYVLSVTYAFVEKTNRSESSLASFDPNQDPDPFTGSSSVIMDKKLEPSNDYAEEEVTTNLENEPENEEKKEKLKENENGLHLPSWTIEMLLLAIMVAIVTVMSLISAFNYVKMTFAYISSGSFSSTNLQVLELFRIFI